MIESSQEAVAPTSPLLELRRALKRIAGRLQHREQPCVWDQAASITSQWSCVFNPYGALVGCVDLKRTPCSDLGPLISEDEYNSARWNSLLEAGLLTESQLRDAADGCEGLEWDTKARQLSTPIVLPRIMRVRREGTAEREQIEQDAKRYLSRDDGGLPPAGGSREERIAEGVRREEAAFAYHSLRVSRFAERIDRELERLTWLQEQARSVEESLGKLPKSTWDNLNKDRPDLSEWDFRVQRKVVDQLSGWPSREGDRLQPFPENARELVELFIACDPRPTWQATADAAEAFAHDLAFVSSLPEEASPRGPSGERGSDDGDPDGSPPGSGTVHKQSDGPVAHRVWAHDGQISEDMPNLAYKLAKYLYGNGKLPRSATSAAIADAVNGSDSDSTTENVKNWQKSANQFFRKNRIPLRIKLSNGEFSMHKCGES